MMKNKEDRFKEMDFSNKNPFQVPEDYFDTFASKMMDRLPERNHIEVTLKPQSRNFVLRRLLYVAACVCVVIFGVSLYWVESTSSTPQTRMAQSVSVVNNDSYIDQVADYTMMDNSDIYSYLSSNDQ